ncbi:hypothetical protein D3C76_1038550 [compost metagenome]
MAHAVDFLEQSRQGQVPVLRTAQTCFGAAAQAFSMTGDCRNAVAHLLDGHRHRTHRTGLRRGTLRHTRRRSYQFFRRRADRCRDTGNLAHGLLEAINEFVECLGRVGHLISAHDPHASGQVAIAQLDRCLFDFPDGPEDLGAQQKTDNDGEYAGGD